MFSFDGYRIAEVTFSPEIVQVQLRLDGRKKWRCPNCQSKVCSEISEMRMARDMPFGPALYALIIYPAIRIRCSHCRRQAWLGPVDNPLLQLHQTISSLD